MSQTLEIEPPAAAVPENSPNATWFQRFQDEAQSRFESLDWPKRTEEYWRFAKLQKADVSGFEPAPSPTDIEPLIAAAADLKSPAARIVFCNHELVHTIGIDESGLSVTSLADADPALVAKPLESLRGELGSAKFMALQQSNQLSALVINVPENLEISAPIEITRWIEGNGVSVFPMTLVLGAANSKITILERVRSADSGQQLGIGGTVLEAGNGARITYAISQELTDSSKFVHVLNAHTGRDAEIRGLVANFGSSWVRQEVSARMDAQGANCELFGVNLVRGTQEVDQRTYQKHLSPNTRSDLLFKNALMDKARTVFSGLIHVFEGAHHTDSFQTCRNLLLSDEVEANALPGLEINADQVSCSHGATSGQIDPEELFYLRARGVHEEQARRIITGGFAAEGAQRLKSEPIQQLLEQLIAERLA
ncbi:MAG: Fe-S cluster assembly protein SufD [Verrucomicrobiales bacterium]|jgi:Fe-S cluster assembly protein SufD